jgi:hypothetical protein
MSDNFRTEITADPAQFNAAMQAMQAHLGALGGAFTKLQSLAVGFGAAIAGGGMFGEAVNQSKEMVVESQKLGRALGISATEASVLAVALGDIHQNSDVMLAANRAMTRTLRENESAFQALGVATKDENGEFKNSLDIMLAVNKRLLEFREGTDRNIEGSRIYGKAWQEVQPVLKLTTDLMEQSKKKAEALGLVVGVEGLEAVTKYRAAMTDVQNVMKAVGKVIGDAVMPILTDLGNWFASTGPDRVEIMRGAMAVLVAGFYSLDTVIRSVWEFIKAFVQVASVALLKFAEVAGRAMKFDFAGAREAWQRGGEQQADIIKQAGERIKAIAEQNGRKAADAFERGFGKPVVTATQRTAGGGATSTVDMAQLEAQLAAERDLYEKRKLAQGSFEQFSKESERAFWQSKISLTAEGSKDRAQIEKKIYELNKMMRKQDFDAEVADLKAQMGAEQTTAEERINLAARVAQITAKAYKTGSKEHIAALAELQKATDAWAKKEIQLQELVIQHDRAFQLSRVELERENLETMEKLGEITARQKLDRLRDLEEMDYQIKLDGAQKELELRAGNEVAYAQHLERIEELKRQHAAKMNQLDNKVKVEAVRVYDEIGQAIGGAFANAFAGVIKGTQTLTETFHNMGRAIFNSLVDLAAKELALAIKTQIAKTLAASTGAGARKTLETAASVQTMAVKGAEAEVVVGDNAAEAASGAAASQASIPYVGWALAAAAFAATMALVLTARSQIRSAAGGFDIPMGINPITQLHQEEMVLPAGIANSLRESLAGGGGVGGNAYHFTIKAMDSRDVVRLFKEQGRGLVDALEEQKRLFYFKRWR